MRLVLGALRGRGGARAGERWLSGTGEANAWSAAVRTPNIARAGVLWVIASCLRGSRVKLKREANLSKVCAFHLSRIALRQYR
jgi:hypothetical protein